MKPSHLILIMFFSVLVPLSCAKVPFTGRKQLKLLPETFMTSMALTQYKEFLTQKPAAQNADADMVRRVGDRIRRAAEVYYTANGLQKRLADFQWEFNLVNDPTVNAWCMPGGKVVVYSGIIPVAKNEDGLAVVMGHEIAHALARHGNERMSQQLSAQLGGIGLEVALRDKPAETRQIFEQAYGVGVQVGALLPFSRLHESEADKIGLYLMAIAGYDVNEAAPFWERMQKKGGQTPPEFLSTHPSPETRAENLKKWAPEAKALATKYKLP